MYNSLEVVHMLEWQDEDDDQEGLDSLDDESEDHEKEVQMKVHEHSISLVEEGGSSELPGLRRLPPRRILPVGLGGLAPAPQAPPPQTHAPQALPAQTLQAQTLQAQAHAAVLRVRLLSIRTGRPAELLLG